MTQATAERTEIPARPRFQASLWGMAIWVLAAAVFFAMVRGARGFWIDWGGPSPPLLDIYRVLGLALLIPATLLAILMLAGMFRLVRSGEQRGAIVFGVAWRALAVLYLVGVCRSESAILKYQQSNVANIFGQSAWQMRLSTLALGLGLLGLLLGVLPYSDRRRPRRGAPRWPGVSVIVAGLAGVLIVGFWVDSPIVYLVLLALEAVKNAVQRPALSFAHVTQRQPLDPVLVDHSLWHSLHERLMSAGLQAGLALAVCMLTACWLARDLRSPGADRRSWRGIAYRILTGLATWAAGAYLFIVTLPNLHPQLAEGFQDILGPSWALLIFGSFGTLAAGLAVRGVAQPPGEDDSSDAGPAAPPPPWFAWMRRLLAIVARLAVIVVLVMIILAAITQIRRVDLLLPWYVPISMSRWLDHLSKPLTVTTPTATYFDPTLTPDALVVVAMAVWIGVWSVQFLVARRRPTAIAPLDQLGRDRHLLGRFLVAWFALTGVMLTLLPAFFLAGMAVFHLTLRSI